MILVERNTIVFFLFIIMPCLFIPSHAAEWSGILPKEQGLPAETETPSGKLVYRARLMASRDFSECYRLAKKASHLAQASGEVIIEAQALRWMAHTFYMTNEHPDSASIYYHKAMKLLMNQTSPEAKALYLIIKTLSVPGSGLEPGERNRRDLEMAWLCALRSGKVLIQAEVLDRLAHAWWQLGFDKHSDSCYLRSIAFWNAAAKKYKVANYEEQFRGMGNKRGTTLNILKRYEECDKELNACLDYARTTGNMLGEASCLMNLGQNALDQNKTNKAIPLLKESIRLYHKLNFQGGYGWAKIILEEAYSKMGSFKDAYEVRIKRYDELYASFESSKRREVYKIRQEFNEFMLSEQKKRFKLIQLLDHKKMNELYSWIGVLILLLVLAMITIITYLFYQRKTTEIKLLKSMIEGQEAERKRIAADVHDSLGGLISAIRNRALVRGATSSVTNFGSPDILGLIDRMGEEIRAVTNNLMPQVLINFGFSAAIRDLVETLNAAGEGKVILDDTCDEALIPTENLIHFYRIIFEGLHNAIKYANASHIYLHLFTEEKKLYMVIEDNGKGFDQNKFTPGRGIYNIRQRVSFLLGKFTIDTSPGKGTSLTMEFPL